MDKKIKSIINSDIYDNEQKKLIISGIELGLDITKYSDPKNSWMKMRQIKIGLEESIDLDPFSKEEYDWEQLREIRRLIGICSINGKSFNKNMINPNMSAKEIKELRLSIIGDKP